MSTRLAIQTLARVFADQTSTFPTDPEYNTLVDAAAKRVWYDLVSSGWPIDFSTTSITASGLATYPIGVGVIGVRDVFYLTGNDFYEIKRVNPGKVAQLRGASSAGYGYAQYYELRINPTSGLVIEFLPKPTSGSYRVDWLPEFTGFANDAAIWYGPARSDELIARAAAADGMRKEGRVNEAAVQEQKYSNLMAEVKLNASWVDMKNPAMIRDTLSDTVGMPFDFPVRIEV